MLITSDLRDGTFNSDTHQYDKRFVAHASRSS